MSNYYYFDNFSSGYYFYPMPYGHGHNGGSYQYYPLYPNTLALPLASSLPPYPGAEYLTSQIPPVIRPSMSDYAMHNMLASYAANQYQVSPSYGLLPRSTGLLSGSISTSRKNVNFMDPLFSSSLPTTLATQRKRKASNAATRYDNSEVVPLINDLKIKIAKLENQLHIGGETDQVRAEYIQTQLGMPILASAMKGLQAMIDASKNYGSQPSKYAKQFANNDDQFVLLLAQQLRYYQSHYKETASKEELVHFLDQFYDTLTPLLFRSLSSSGAGTLAKDSKLSRDSVHQLMEALITLLVTDGLIAGGYEEFVPHKSFDYMIFEDFYYLIQECTYQMRLEFGQFHAILLRLLRDSVKESIFALRDSNQEKIRQQKRSTDQRVGLLLNLLKNLSTDISFEHFSGKSSGDAQSVEPIIYEIFAIFELYSKSKKDFSFFDVNMRPLEFAKSFILQFVAKCAKQSAPESNSWKCFSLVQREIESSKRLASSVSMYSFLENRGHSIEAILSLNKQTQQQQAEVSAQENPAEPAAAVEEIASEQPTKTGKLMLPKKNGIYILKPGQTKNGAFTKFVLLPPLATTANSVTSDVIEDPREVLPRFNAKVAQEQMEQPAEVEISDVFDEEDAASVLFNASKNVRKVVPTVSTANLKDIPLTFVAASTVAVSAKETPVPETSKQQSKEEILAQVQTMHQNLYKSQQKINEMLRLMAEKKN